MGSREPSADPGELRGLQPGAGWTVYAAACVIGCGRGRAGLDPEVERDLLNQIDLELERSGRAGLLWFGSPQVLPPGLWNRPGLCVAILYAPADPLQLAAAEFLAAGGRVPSTGRLPVQEPV